VWHRVYCRRLRCRLFFCRFGRIDFIVHNRIGSVGHSAFMSPGGHSFISQNVIADFVRRNRESESAVGSLKTMRHCVKYILP
jgi:hypothetical protein